MIQQGLDPHQSLDPWQAAQPYAAPVDQQQADDPMLDAWRDLYQTRAQRQAEPAPTSSQQAPTRPSATSRGPWGVTSVPATTAPIEGQEQAHSSSSGNIEMIRMPYCTVPIISGVPVAQMITACPRVEMPQFTQHDSFSYLRTGEVRELRLEDQLSPL